MTAGVYKVVPVEPTDDMIIAFAETWYTKVRCIDDCEMEDAYAAMLAAAPDVAAPDPIVEANRQLLLDRSRVGVEKYGTTLADAGLSHAALVRHALEETLDLANYLQGVLATPQHSVTDQDEPEAWIRKTDITELTDSEPETGGWTPLYPRAQPLVSTAATQPEQAPFCWKCSGDREVVASYTKGGEGRQIPNMVPCPECAALAIPASTAASEQPACRWPTCLPEAEQSKLAQEVLVSMGEIPAASEQQASVSELPPLPAQHDELRARWKCEDCDGTGEVGEPMDQGYFQPPERARCSTCDGAGQVPIAAYTDEQMQAYARAALSGRATIPSDADEIPAVLFDGHAVLAEVTAHGPNPPRTSADNVAEVLDAVVRLMRRGAK